MRTPLETFEKPPCNPQKERGAGLGMGIGPRAILGYVQRRLPKNRHPPINANHEGTMRKRTACAGMLSASFAALLCAASATNAAAQPAAGAQIRIDADDIGGVVT